MAFNQIGDYLNFDPSIGRPSLNTPFVYSNRPNRPLTLKPGGRLKEAWRTYRQSSFHRGGTQFLKWELGIGKEFAGKGTGAFISRWASRAFLGFSVLQGYSEGGISGAVLGGATHLATSYLMGGVLGSMGTPLALGMGMAGIGLGLHFMGGGKVRDFFRPYVYDYMKKQSRLEMSTPVMDDFGTVATMRQRSLMAIQNSRLNGRTALGQEAALSFQPIFR